MNHVPLYNLANIRELLIKGFSVRDLRSLCYYMPLFHPVDENLAPKASKAEIVDQLIRFAEEQLLIDTLLVLAKEHSPRRYERHKPYYLGDPVSALQSSILDLSRQLVVMVSSLCAYYAPAKVHVVMNRLDRIADLLHMIFEMRVHDDWSAGYYNLHELLNYQTQLEIELDSLLGEHACALVGLSHLDRVKEWELAMRRICVDTATFDLATADEASREYIELLTALNQVRSWIRSIEIKRESVTRDVTELEQWLSGRRQAVGRTRAPAPYAEFKHAREQADLTQAALAQLVGVSRTTISRWERLGVAPRSAETRNRISALLACRLWPENAADSQGDEG